MTRPKDQADLIAATERDIAAATFALRAEFLETVPLLTELELQSRSISANTVLTWRREGKVFCVHQDGRDLYPAFQFDSDNRPLPIVAELLSRLKRDPERTDWDNALWFAGDTGWLDGARPLDRLHSNPDALRQAAEQEALRDAE